MADNAKVIDSEEAKNSEIDFDELLRKYDTEARFRLLHGWQAKLVTILAVAMTCFHFYTAGFGLFSPQIQGAIHLAFALVLTLLLYPLTQKTKYKNVIPWYDFIIATIGAVVALYLVVNFKELAERAGNPTQVDLIMGFLLIIVLLEATRRISNPVLSCLAIVALFYCYFGKYLGAHAGFSVSRIINHMYLGTEGIFSTPLEVSSTFVFMFILFGAVLEKTGIGKFIIDLSLALAGWSTGGPAKVAVVASGIMGTVSGSSVANVCTIGMFTIPLMKSVGYRPHFAGAVEATASTGGQIMPPVMGSAAFIMAQMLGIPYLEVAKAAIIPALLYYVSVLVQVHLEAQRLGLKGLSRDRLPRVWFLLKTKGFLLLPLVVIVYFLLGGSTPLRAAFYGILACIPLSWLNKETRLTPRKIFEAFESGARSALSIACACGCVGLIIGTGTLTGLAMDIANGIVDLAGGMLLPTLILTMLASIVLGTGLPTTANFIVTSAMAAPAIMLLEIAPGVKVEPLAAYMFVLYFGIAADLTPPVALAAYAGAGIAGADPMVTGLVSFKLALAGLLVPYMYVFNPVLLLLNPEPMQIIQALITSMLGVFLLGIASIGYFKGKVHWVLRILALLGALGLLHPGTLTDLLGLTALVFIVALQWILSKRQVVIHP